MDSFRQKMDEQGMAVAENQEISLKSRRRLAETTRGDPHKASAPIVTCISIWFVDTQARFPAHRVQERCISRLEPRRRHLAESVSRRS